MNDEKVVVGKVLKSLTPKLDQVVIVMEQSRVTKKMDCEELITSLMDQ